MKEGKRPTENEPQAADPKQTTLKDHLYRLDKRLMQDNARNQMVLATAYLLLDLRGYFPPKALISTEDKSSFGNIDSSAKDIRQVVLDFMVSRSITDLSEIFTSVPEWLEEVISLCKQGDLVFLSFFLEGIEEILPYIREEVEERQGQNTDPISFYDFMQEIDPHTRGSMFTDALRRAVSRLEIARAGERLSRDLPRLQSILPDRHTIPNNKLANELQRGLINMGAMDLVVGKKGKQGDITAYTLVSTEEIDDLEIEGNYTEYDRQVQNAVCSLYLYGDEAGVFTPAMVYRAMTNGTNTADPSAQQVGAVTRSLEKQRRIHVKVDASEELRTRGYTDEDGNPVQFKYDDFLLNLRGLEVRAGGRVVKGYLIKEEPVLLSYSRASRQLLTIRPELLDVKEIGQDGRPTESSIANTESRIVIKGYLLRRVEVMKNACRRAADSFRKYESRKRKDGEDKALEDFMHQSRRILFETLFDETGITTANRVTQRRNREYAFQVLDYWKAVGYISGYSPVKGERNSVRGIDIEL